MNSESKYLRYIYHLSQGESKAGVTEVSRYAGVSKPAVTIMLRKLAADGLVDYFRYRPVSLTPKGVQLAIHYVRIHRIWETYLFEVLHLPLNRIHEEAELLEGSTSEYLLQRLNHILRFPRFDPHGDPIPDKLGRIISCDHYLKLTDVVKNGKYRIVRTGHYRQQAIDFFVQERLFPNSIVTFLEKNDEIIIQTGRKKLAIPAEFAAELFVIPG
ncbi:MAG: metal-dependent transcriptional regulator [Bacteroidetes bacterium]|nr:metal-dependent transcriptional regulator [Bacteroidota bacterium]MBU1721010.1 metal-dependent transcriptional regulator [Bacteroidota bacterium]